MYSGSCNDNSFRECGLPNDGTDVRKKKRFEQFAGIMVPVLCLKLDSECNKVENSTQQSVLIEPFFSGGSISDCKAYDLVDNLW